MIKFLYIIDYWFPEYDGVLNLIASSDEEAFEIISTKKLMKDSGWHESEIKYHYEYNEKYKNRVWKNICKSQRFPLCRYFYGVKEYHSGILYFISFKR